MTEQMAELLGLLRADGWVAPDWREICFTNTDADLRAHVAVLWARCFLGRSHRWAGHSE